jgi:uncharacterized protein
MSDSTRAPMGVIAWTDLTVPNASAVRDFYAAVCGWRAAPVSMGEYEDYGMVVGDGDQTVAGICHARGSNADLPAQWLNYVTVPDLEASLTACLAGGGAIVRPARELGGYGTMAVIRDPAGAVLALMQPPT